MKGVASVTFENILGVRKFRSSLLMLHFSLISDFSHDRRIRGNPAIRWWQPGRSSINGAKLWTSWTHRRSKKMRLKFVVHRFDEKNWNLYWNKSELEDSKFSMKIKMIDVAICRKIFILSKKRALLVLSSMQFWENITEHGNWETRAIWSTNYGQIYKILSK